MNVETHNMILDENVNFMKETQYQKSDQDIFLACSISQESEKDLWFLA